MKKSPLHTGGRFFYNSRNAFLLFFYDLGDLFGMFVFMMDENTLNICAAILAGCHIVNSEGYEETIEQTIEIYARIRRLLRSLPS